MLNRLASKIPSAVPRFTYGLSSPITTVQTQISADAETQWNCLSMYEVSQIRGKYISSVCHRVSDVRFSKGRYPIVSILTLTVKHPMYTGAGRVGAERLKFNLRRQCCIIMRNISVFLNTVRIGW